MFSKIQLMRRSLFLLFVILGSEELLIPTQTLAAQFNYCYPIQQMRTISDPGYHPNAYDDGYREGIAEARDNKPFAVRTAGGEFAKGYEDGYNGRSYVGQQKTLPDRRESYQSQKCRNYFYNEKDPIEQTLRRVLDNFQEDFRRDGQIKND
ncbi:MAG: hypothetical protein ACRC6M_19005 [Microcystaceae cyanobacterium]